MKYTSLTKRQLKASNTIENIVIWFLCPIWIPLAIVAIIISDLCRFLEHLILNEANDLVTKFSNWLAKKLYK